MPKSSVKELICESCNEQDAVRKLEGLGYACQDCAEAFEDLHDDETKLPELDDKEIDSLVALDGLEDEDDSDESYDRRELERDGFVVSDEDEESYN